MHSTVLRGAPDSLLDGYRATRRPIAQQVVALTDWLATLPPALRPIRNVLLGLIGRMPAVRRGLAARLSGLVYR